MTDLAEVTIDQNVEDGFYSWEDDTLNFAPNFVQWPDRFLIERAKRDEYEYPVRGYYWFETRNEALSFFEKPDPDIDSSLPNELSLMGMYGDEHELPNGPIAPDVDYEELIADPHEFAYTPEDLEYDPGNPIPEADDIVTDPPDMWVPHA